VIRAAAAAPATRWCDWTMRPSPATSVLPARLQRHTHLPGLRPAKTALGRVAYRFGDRAKAVVIASAVYRPLHITACGHAPPALSRIQALHRACSAEGGALTVVGWLTAAGGPSSPTPPVATTADLPRPSRAGVEAELRATGILVASMPQAPVDAPFAQSASANQGAD